MKNLLQKYGIFFYASSLKLNRTNSYCIFYLKKKVASTLQGLKFTPVKNVLFYFYNLIFSWQTTKTHLLLYMLPIKLKQNVYGNLLLCKKKKKIEVLENQEMKFFLILDKQVYK